MKRLAVAACGFAALLAGMGPKASAAPATPGNESDGVDLVWMTVSLRDPQPSTPVPKATRALVATGAKLYRARCASCHGLGGDGRGPEASRLSVPATDFSQGIYKLRATPSGSLPTDTDLFVSLSRGMHGTPMMPWSALAENERWALVHHLKSLSPRFAAEDPDTSVDVPEAPPVTTALIAHGKKQYRLFRCGACHGENGDGKGPAAATLTTDTGRHVRIRDFASGRFLRSPDLRDIYLTLWTGLDGSPMGSYAYGLSPYDTFAIAAFVQTLVRQRSIRLQ